MSQNTVQQGIRYGRLLIWREFWLLCSEYRSCSRLGVRHFGRKLRSFLELRQLKSHIWVWTWSYCPISMTGRRFCHSLSPIFRQSAKLQMDLGYYSPLATSYKSYPNSEDLHLFYHPHRYAPLSIRFFWNLSQQCCLSVGGIWETISLSIRLFWRLFHRDFHRRRKSSAISKTWTSWWHSQIISTPTSPV